MEAPHVILFHAVAVCIVLYIIMTVVLKQPPTVALNRTLILGAIFVVYSIVYGYNLPGAINPDLFI